VENLDLPVETQSAKLDTVLISKQPSGGALPNLGRDKNKNHYQNIKEITTKCVGLLTLLDELRASCYMNERSEWFIARSANAVSVHLATLNATNPTLSFFPTRFPLGRGVSDASGNFVPYLPLQGALNLSKSAFL
jgi:hypothetical protein